MGRISHCGALARAAWADRGRTTPGQRLRSEMEFLPAALALIETPPSPGARGLLWGSLVFIAITLAWAFLGELDIIAVARGRIVPSGQVKVVQPLETAVVRRLLVRDGLPVRKGQLLIELDATGLGADRERVQDGLDDAALAAARARSLLAAARAGAASARPLAVSGERRTERREAANRLLAAEYQAYRGELATLDAEARHLQAQQATLEAMLDKLEALQPLLEQRASDLQRLLDQHFVPRHDYLDAENRRTENVREIEVQRRRAGEVAALVVRQREQRAATVADFERRTRETLLQAEQQLAQWRQEGARLRSRAGLLELRAPVDGTVQQLAVHTEGGVVTGAQPLLVIVPANERLEIDAVVENKDIGFIHPGQEAVVKVEAFPFTRYGMLQGRVVNLSLDAVADEKRGLMYQARVLLDRAAMTVEGRRVPLLPGMAVSVEIKTGRRRIIDYFLSPVLQYGSESARER